MWSSPIRVTRERTAQRREPARAGGSGKWGLAAVRQDSREAGGDHGRHDLICWKAWTSSCRQLVTLHSSLGQKFLSSRAKMREKIRLHTFVCFFNKSKCIQFKALYFFPDCNLLHILLLKRYFYKKRVVNGSLFCFQFEVFNVFTKQNKNWQLYVDLHKSDFGTSQKLESPEITDVGNRKPLMLWSLH